MSEINIEIAEHLAIPLIPQQLTVKMLRNGKVGEVTRESVLRALKYATQIGLNAQGEGYRMGLALWIRHSMGTDHIETIRDNVDELALSLGVELPH